MKSISIFGLFFTIIQIARAQTQNPPAIGESPTAYATKERGANNRVWEKIEYEMHDGHQVPHVHRVTELATGMHYLKDGAWTESKENIQILPNGGAAATEGQHQVFFPADIYNGVIEVVTLDGLHLKSRPIGISYYDGQNSVLIAELKPSIGQLVSSNQIVYPDAFTDFKADLVCTYKRSGFECDLVFREQPPGPEVYNLNPDSSRVELWTEFIDTPEPKQEGQPLNQSDALADTTLTFGQMQMVQGKAFSVGDQPQRSRSRISVYKNWAQIDGRSVLVEQVPYIKMSAELQKLPASASSASTKTTATVRKVAKERELPPARLVQKSATNAVQIASADLKNKRGVVLDYVEITSTETDYTFLGNTTYYISGTYDLSGTTTFEGGAVLKVGSSGTILIDAGGTIDCKTATYRPALITSINDESAGESIDGSTGTPSVGDYGLGLYIQATNNTYLHDLRISYCTEPILMSAASSLIVENCQLFKMSFLEVYSVWLRNVLITSGNGPADPDLYLYGPTLRGEHVTVDNGINNGGYFSWPQDSGQAVNLTNCLITCVGLVQPSTGAIISTQNVAILPSNAGVFQTVGAGNYYLATNSIYRDAGTTNLDPVVRANIRSRTTYPPILYTDTTIAGGTFSPQAQRDTDMPDIGYHYDALDYIFDGVSSSTNLTFAAGTAVGWHEFDYYGLSVPDLVNISFNGTVTDPCTYSRFDTVQEDAPGNWAQQGSYGIVAIGYNSAGDHAARVNGTFTRFTQFPGPQNIIREGNICMQVHMNHSEFSSGSDGGYGIKFYLTNCLLDRLGGFGVQAANSGSDTALVMRNCTMIGGYVLASRWGNWPVWIQNCAFDGVDLSQVDDPSGGDTNITYCNYNAFLTNLTRLPESGTNDVIVTPSFNWQTGLLGYFYEPTNSPLINKGSTTADLVGLYHFTTQTNQVKESNSVVDIGYHYVAVDANGIPIDTDGDGTSDYLEDSNGNGGFDIGDLSDWLLSPFNGLTGANGLSVFTPLK